MGYAQGADARGVVKKIANSGQGTYAQRDQSYEEAKGVAPMAPGKGDGDDAGDKGYSGVYLSTSGRKIAATGKGPKGGPGPKSAFSASSPSMKIEGPRAKGGK